jgi:hypothetical protein
MLGILHEGDEADPVTGLQQKTHYGRPNWDKIFETLSKNHAGYVLCYKIMFYVSCTVFKKL